MKVTAKLALLAAIISQVKVQGSPIAKALLVKRQFMPPSSLGAGLGGDPMIGGMPGGMPQGGGFGPGMPGASGNMGAMPPTGMGMDPSNNGMGIGSSPPPQPPFGNNMNGMSSNGGGMGLPPGPPNGVGMSPPNNNGVMAPPPGANNGAVGNRGPTSNPGIFNNPLPASNPANASPSGNGVGGNPPNNGANGMRNSNSNHPNGLPGNFGGNNPNGLPPNGPNGNNLNQNKSNDGRGTSTGFVVGLSVGLVSLFLAVVGGAIFFIRRQKRNQSSLETRIIPRQQINLPRDISGRAVMYDDENNISSMRVSAIHERPVSKLVSNIPPPASSPPMLDKYLDTLPRNEIYNVEKQNEIKRKPVDTTTVSVPADAATIS